MMTPYKRAMSSLALSPQARERIEGRPRRKPVRRRAVRPAVTAAVLLALVLGTTAMADGVFSHDIPAAIVQSLTPVRLSDTSQGITMTVQSAGVEDGVFAAYITMQDQRGGGRLARGVGIYDSYRINTPFRSDLVASGCTPLGYDEASQSSWCRSGPETGRTTPWTSPTDASPSPSGSCCWNRRGGRRPLSVPTGAASRSFLSTRRSISSAAAERISKPTAAGWPAGRR